MEDDDVSTSIGFDSMEEDDIAAAMGFSSFGGTKKRKIDQTDSPEAKIKASGANSTKLGVRSKIMDGGDHFNVSSQQQELGSEENTSTIESIETAIPALKNVKGTKKHPAATGLGDFLARGQNLPDKLPNADRTAASNTQEDDPSSMVSFGGPPVSKAELNALRQGVRNKEGDTAYFLPSFIEDPWEKLAKSRR